MKRNQTMLFSNDGLRTLGNGGKIVITPSVFNLGCRALEEVISLIKNYDTNEINLNSGNVYFDGNIVFWKIETLTSNDTPGAIRALIIYTENDAI